MVNGVVTPGRLELPAYGLGNRRSILLSYGVAQELRQLLPHLPGFCQIVRISRFNRQVFRPEETFACLVRLFRRGYRAARPYPGETDETCFE